MKRTVIAGTLLALLAFPAAALAHGGDHGDRGHHGNRGHEGRTTHGPVVFASHGGAQSSCRAERDQLGNDDFKAKYGTNGNGANAFGKCVSQGGPHTVAPITTIGMRSAMLEFASGSITSFGASGCNTSTSGCAITANGAIEGRPIAHGSWSAALTAVWTSATSNGAGGYCAPTSGTVALSDGTNTITESVQGSLCEIGATGANVGHVFIGSYSVTSGTGTYANASGSGRVGFYQPSGTGYLEAVEQGGFATS